MLKEMLDCSPELIGCGGAVILSLSSVFDPSRGAASIDSFSRIVLLLVKIRDLFGLSIGNQKELPLAERSSTPLPHENQ